MHSRCQGGGGSDGASVADALARNIEKKTLGRTSPGPVFGFMRASAPSTAPLTGGSLFASEFDRFGQKLKRLCESSQPSEARRDGI